MKLTVYFVKGHCCTSLLPKSNGQHFYSTNKLHVTLKSIPCSLITQTFDKKPFSVNRKLLYRFSDGYFQVCVMKGECPFVDNSNCTFRVKSTQNKETMILEVLLMRSMLWSIDTCQSNVSSDQYYVTIARAQV